MAKPVYGNDGPWRKLLARVAKLDGGPHVKVGVLGSTGGGFGVVALAATHELGSPRRGIPARSFVRRTFEENQAELGALTGKLAKGIVVGRLDVERALGLLGTWGANEVKRFITTQKVRPRLEESEAGRRTIARKGSSVTLVDTGRLLGSISWQVVPA